MQREIIETEPTKEEIQEFIDEECIKEYLSCLDVGELVEMLQPLLTQEQRSQIFIELDEEYRQMQNER